MKTIVSSFILWCDSLTDIVSKCKKTCFVILGVMMVVTIVLSWFWCVINHDTVYYMNTIKLMTEGYTPYSDFKLGYTPLTFYLLWGPAHVFGTQLPFALSCAYLALLLDAVLVFLICLKQTQSKSLAIFGTLSFLMLSWHFEADSFYLEPFVLLFGLSSILLLLSSKKAPWIILSGVLCFMSFWTKQYGLGFIFLATAYVLVENWFSKKGWRNAVLLWAGFWCGAFLFIGIMIMQGVEMHEMFGLSGTRYYRVGLYGLWLGFKAIFRWCCPFFIIVLFSIWNFRKVIKDPFFVMVVLGIAGFVLQTYVRPYGHYLILMSPFCIFSVVYSLRITANTSWALPLKMMCIVMTVAFVQRLWVKNIDVYENRHARSEIKEISKEMEQFIPRGSHNVYPYSDYDRLLAYQHETLPPVTNKKCLGISFEGSEDMMGESIKSSDYVIANGLANPKANFLLETIFEKYEVRGYYVFVKKK